MDLDNYPTIKFCRVQKGTKKPFEQDWVNKPYTFEQIQKYLPDENYGILCGYGNLAVIDADTNELQLAVESLLPNTFRVKTGSGGTHNYFFIKDLLSKIICVSKEDKGNEKHWGEVQWKGQQVIGPGSIHPNGNKYEIVNNEQIAEITYKDLMQAIGPFTKQVNEAIEFSRHEQEKYLYDIDSLNVADIWGLGGLKGKRSEYYGEHPIHGSDTGMNFWINPFKNVWHCFRHQSGGGPLSAIAVKEGIINCSDAQAGLLRGDKAREAIEIAKEKYGLTIQEQRHTENKIEVIKTIETIQGLKLWTFKDFKNLRPDKSFIIQNVIYPKTVTMLYSPPGQFKSLLALYLAMSVAKGKQWMNFKSKKMPVLYCDKENNDQLIKQRLEGLYNGMGIRASGFPLYFLRREGDLLDERFVFKLKKAVEDNKIKLVIFDTLHRFADYDENKSDDINRIYTKVFQPLVEEFGVSIIFLHHTRKDGGYRGSGDFLGMVDVSYAIFREGKSNRFQIINEKCRSGEIENIYGQIDFGEDYIKVLQKSAEEDKSTPKLRELTIIVKEMFKPGEKLRRKDIETNLEQKEYDFSVATLKRVLKWLNTTNQIDNDGKGGYSLIQR